MDILYIEDDLIDELAFKRITSKLENITVTSCKNFTEAIDLLSQNNFNIIFLDFNTNDNNKRDVFLNLIKVPFVVLSGLLHLSDEESLYKKGMLTSVVKPITMDRFAHIMEGFFSKKSLKESKEVPEMSYLRNLSEGDIAFENTLMQIAIDELPANIESIHNAMKTENKREVIELLHKVKTKVILAGMTNLAGKISTIENEVFYTKEDINFVILKLEEIYLFFKYLVETQSK